MPMSADLQRPALLRPEPGTATLKSVRWGGTRLAGLRGVTQTSPPIGESWEFSTLPGSPSRAQGRALSEILGGPLPFLAKLIDTAAPLSIQVHPTDAPQRAQLGKEEAWVILGAEPGASVLAGVRRGVDDETLDAGMRRAIADPADEAALLGLLESIQVRRGTVIVVPAGTVHAIGPGILLAEIQQPVDCTYRLFDYGSGRPIHPDAARSAWRVHARPEIWHPGDPVRPLAGEHVTLELWCEAIHVIAACPVPRLLVAVGGDVVVRVEDGDGACEVTMRHGDLVLHVAGALHTRAAPGAMLVTGTV